MAFGKQRYLDQARNLARSLRRFMPRNPIALATDTDDTTGLFDHVVKIDRSKGGSFKQKLWLDYYSPFSNTLLTDADCIIGSSFDKELEEMQNYSFTPVCERYLHRGERDENGWVEDLDAALDAVGGDVYPKFNGGVYYFDKSDKALEVFKVAREYLARADELGLKNPSGGEPGDETLFALALSSLKMLPVYDDDARLMRTPIGIQGKFEMKRFGDFSFVKYGKRVSPAICHFAGAGVLSLPYLRLQHFLLHDKISPMAEARLRLTYLVKGHPHYLRAMKRMLVR